jgi:hypothetical protein
MINPNGDKIEELVKKHPKKFTYEEIAQKVKDSEDAVRGIISRRGLRNLVKPFVLHKEVVMPRKTKKEVSQEAKLEAKLRAASKDKSNTDRKYKAIQDELERSNTALEQALEIMSRRPKPFKISSQKGSRGEGTCVALLSDVHCEELVPKHKVNYLNEHTPEISKRRVSKFFDLVVRFIRIERQETEVENLILWLGGDFFTNDMHGAPTAFPPMIAAMFAQDMIISGIQFIIDNEPNLKIHVVGSVGNHSRQHVGKMVNQALEQEFSLEWMMYHAVKKHFDGYDRISFQLDNSYHSYVKVYDKTIRFNHGHLHFRYNNGLAGIHGPLGKVINQSWNKQIRADLTCVAHYHTYTPAGLERKYTVNGSTIGMAPYGLAFGYEPPSQAFFLIHNKYGLVGQHPLFVDTT